jgi:hypothetical protein
MSARRTAASGGMCARICRKERPGGAAANHDNEERSGPDLATIVSLRQPPPAAPAQNGFGSFIVSLPCGADLSWIYRASPPLLTLSPW